MSRYTYDRRTAGTLSLGPGHVDEKNTATLKRMKKLRAKYHPGDLAGATESAAYYAQKYGKTMYVYAGNSYGHGVYRVTYKMSDVTSPISNTGSFVMSVTPDGVISKHDVHGRINFSEDT